MSAFTALNGGSPKASEPPNPPADASRAAPSDGRPNGQPTPSELKSTTTVTEASTATESSIATEPSTSQRESWAGPSQDRSPYQSANYPDVDGSHKRKRSNSVEPRREAPPPKEKSPGAASHSHPPESRDLYETPSRERDPRSYAEREDLREHGDSWYSREGRERDERVYYDQPSATSTQGQSEEQIGEALRRANQMDGHDYDNTSPDGDDRSMAYGSYTPGGSRDSALQSDKKRKRNFSNRTKTGCLTCRRRKKKCDEQKPECSNCLRGGFVCAGYPPQRNTAWQKPDSKGAAIPLESKDPSYVPPGAYGMPQQAPYGSQPAIGQRREPLPHYRGQPLRIDPPQGRPLLTDDDRPTASTIPSSSVTSPENKLSAIPYTPANAFPTPVSAQGPPHAPFSERKEYQRVPPLHDISRTGPEPETPHPGNTLPQINILHPTRSNSPIPQQQQPPPPPPPPQPQATTNVQVAAQLALSHTQFSPSRTRTQKEDMLNGKLYYPFDKELVLERERCSAACWRFNNSTNPNNGVSPTERARLFREILQPRDPIQISPTVASPVANLGRVGEHVVVEAPFTCDYGYNISIGQNVLIGRSCTIIDTCEVKIGDNCHIGPNVSIYTATLPTDPKKRMGSKGPQFGMPITIGEDCFIGGGVIILPGVTIGRGSTVGAGSVVTKDVPPFTIAVGNAARIIRGISS
ncbi:putative maltose O-acetyltransferase [Colletotrichum tanaceti]|uniref:Putative maltose O-acetyltransferase n=1 Tax=Colletotrichum tanaceti TaxID=1306861 RepID=A0A4U6X2K1_9PEZI|nr:putative maltose O-acetyltransferase [Colletotrichum tanaceti]TKW49580.1 putative maltose O-acetyltransferase [Colletotrichum tanaceti]